MKFWQELRRRRVYRLAGLYIVGAWLVIQVVEMLFQAWGIPESALRYLFIAAAACFPVALIFSWFYDITTRGIIRTEAAGGIATARLKLKRADYIILTALFGVGLTILLGSADKIQQEIETGPATTEAVERRENSIAVLPFVNLDTNPDTGYFSDGVTEEILMRLSSLRVLHVLGQTSSFAFRNSTDGPARISEILGVRYLLQGSVRRDGDQLRITAKLIDEFGFQIWGQTFDRKLENIFVIQSEIASSVSTQILNEIVPLSERSTGSTTTNMDAYNEYLVGKALFNSRGLAWIEKSASAFRRAIALDPGFAPPYTGLAFTTSYSDLDEAWQLVEQALALDQLLAEGHAVAGLLQFLIGKDYAGAEKSLHRALELDPALGNAYNWLSNLLLAQGRVAESVAVQEKGLEIDPLNPPMVRNAADRHIRHGDFDRAEKLLLRLAYLPDPPRAIYFHLKQTYYQWGHLDQVIYWHQQGLRAVDNKVTADEIHNAGFTRQLLGHFEAYAMLGLFEDASYWLESGLRPVTDEVERFIYRAYLSGFHGGWPELKSKLDTFEQQTKTAYHDLPPGTTQNPGWSTIPPTKKNLGWLNILAGNYTFGIELFEPAVYVDSLEDASNYNILRRLKELEKLYALAFAYQQVGRDAAARDLLLELQTVIEPLAASGEMMIAGSFASLALNRSLLGDKDGALQAFEKAVELGWINYYWVINNPVWASTIALPGFQRLLSEVKIEVDRQRALVEAENDFRAEAERILAPMYVTDE